DYVNRRSPKKPSRLTAWRLFVCATKLDNFTSALATPARLHKVSAWQAFVSPLYELQFFLRRIWQWLIITVLAGAGCGQQSAPISDFAAQRQRMVAEQLKARGISDDRVLAAMNKVQREEFVPADVKTSSYDDQALPIGQGQT